MPGRSGLQVLPELRARMPFIAIVVLTAHSEPIYMEEAFRRGADGYVLKSELMKDLLSTIRTGLLRRQELRFEDLRLMESKIPMIDRSDSTSADERAPSPMTNV